MRRRHFNLPGHGVHQSGFIASPDDQPLISGKDPALVAELEPAARPDFRVYHPDPSRGHGDMVDVAPAARLAPSCRTMIPGIASRVWPTFFSPGAPVATPGRVAVGVEPGPEG